MDFAKLAAERYSLRKFSDRPVEAEKLSAVLEAGRNAPTAHNLQPQRIFVLQSPEALEKVDGCTGAHFRPPVMLVVAYDPAVSWKREATGWGSFPSRTGRIRTVLMFLAVPALDF